ncbi:MAG: hypothetical protein AB7I38_16150 [Dehalococcoidia bacterium]
MPTVSATTDQHTTNTPDVLAVELARATVTLIHPDRGGDRHP